MCAAFLTHLRDEYVQRPSQEAVGLRSSPRTTISLQNTNDNSKLRAAKGYFRGLFFSWILRAERAPLAQAGMMLHNWFRRTYQWSEP
jgi:hypothetical protein